jgi:1-acyl-sn-glycerol-3-phosphate acyltransferase
MVLWTILLGAATPILMLWNDAAAIRAYSIFWAKGIAWGIKNIIGLDYNIEGVIPDDKRPYIVVSNHQSMWETIILVTLIPNVTFVAKKELTRVPIFGWYMRKFPMILIDRSTGRSALAEILSKSSEAVENGHSILIFPEGTRCGPDETKKYHFGVAALYSKLGIPALTIAHNSGCFWNDEYSMKYNGTVTLKIIETIEPGMQTDKFLNHLEQSINEEKLLLVQRVNEDDWRWALG